tara:strand:- start:1 stop:159 length:159 start_codon:yes stop_codon:yes gene_type:complete
MMKKKEREKKRSRAHITPHDASPGKPRLIIITIALPTLLFSEEEEQQQRALL